MSSSESSAKKPKFVQPILSHFLQAQSSLSTLTSPDCDPVLSPLRAQMNVLPSHNRNLQNYTKLRHNHQSKSDKILTYI